MYNNLQLICITGSDGAGKSTLIKHLKSQLQNSLAVSIWDAMSDPSKSPFSDKSKVDAYLCHLSADARLLFLSHALKYAIDRAVQIAGLNYLLIDAYYYKYFASEKVLGAGPTLIHSMETLFPTPDKHILLEVPMETTMLRKQYFSAYECGCNTPNATNFLEFQKKALPFFKQYQKENWKALDGLQELPALVAQSLDYINA